LLNDLLLKKTINDKIISHYSKLFQKYGNSPKSLGWLNGRQKTRFKVMTEVGITDNCSVLDVGCGFGDFYSYLKTQKNNFYYQGIDINPTFINLAKTRYPNTLFQVLDIKNEKINKKFDWVIATGITNYAVSYFHIKSMLKEMFKIAKKGVVMDFISNYVDYRKKDIFYTSPEVMFQFAKTLTKRICLRHDYMPYEFSIYLYKNDLKTKKNLFKNF